MPNLPLTLVVLLALQLKVLNLAKQDLSQWGKCNWRTAEVESVQDAALMKMVNPWNHHHAMAEFAPTMHAVACQHLDRCSYDNIEGFRCGNPHQTAQVFGFM